MATHTLTETVTLTTLTCPSCSVVFAMPVEMRKARERDRQSFYCPAGHSQWFPGKTVEKERDEARAQLEAAQRTTQHLRTRIREEQAETAAARRSAAAYKGALTKARKRVGKGTCPECKRHFPALREHMAAKHPEHATKTEA